MNKKVKISRDLLVLSILTLVTILTWIGIDVYRRLTKSEIPQVLEKELLPLDSKIETDIFDDLEKRLENISYSPPTPTLRKEASPAAEISQ